MKKLIFILLFLICLTGCENNTKDINTANAVAVDFIESFMEMDYAHMYSITQDMEPYYINIYNPDDEIIVKIFKELGRNLEYSIKDTKIKGDKAIVSCNLKTLDASDLITKIAEEVNENPDVDINELIDKQIILCKRRDIDTEYNMIRVGETWVIESNSDIYDDLCGGFLQFSYNLGSAVN